MTDHRRCHAGPREPVTCSRLGQQVATEEARGSAHGQSPTTAHPSAAARAPLRPSIRKAGQARRHPSCSSAFQAPGLPSPVSRRFTPWRPATIDAPGTVPSTYEQRMASVAAPQRDLSERHDARIVPPRAVPRWPARSRGPLADGPRPAAARTHRGVAVSGGCSAPAPGAPLALGRSLAGPSSHSGRTGPRMMLHGAERDRGALAGAGRGAVPPADAAGCVRRAVGPCAVRYPGERPAPDQPIAILTRAAIRPTKLLPFWRAVPTPRHRCLGHPALRAQRRHRATGRWFARPTFSVWIPWRAHRTTPTRRPEHRAVIERRREERWYSSELFARFVPLEGSGSWNGSDPLAR